MNDLHHHCIWEMGDGPKTFSEACQMMQQAYGAGITTLAATPHAYPGYLDFDMTGYRRKLAQLRCWVQENDLPLTILEGAEIWYTDRTLSLLRQGRIPTLGGTAYVLVEFSPKVTVEALEKALDTLFRGGYIPIVAHIERYPKLFLHIPRLLRLRRELDACFQVNASSLTAKGRLGQKLFLRKLFDRKAIDLIATDAHDCICRPPELRAGLSRLEGRYGREYLWALTHFDLGSPLKTT